MLDLGWQELFLITLVALIVVGPKDLPLLIRSITGWLRSARKMAKDFQTSLEEVARETELDRVREISEYSFERNISEFVSDGLDSNENITKGKSVINQGESNVNEVNDGLSLPTKTENQGLQPLEVKTKPENSKIDSNLIKLSK
jgi:sec-independent protein translocase protein TatB